MRTKTKNFFEDVFVLLILVVIIFFVYFFFFSNNQIPQIIESKNQTSTIEEKIEDKSNDNPIIDKIKTYLTQEKIENNNENKTVQVNTEPVQNQPIVQPKELNVVNQLENVIKEEPKEQTITETTQTNIEAPIVTEVPTTNETTTSEEIHKVEPSPSDSLVQDIQTNENENKDINDSNNENEIISIEQFFKNFEKKVYENINKNVDKSLLRSGQFVNIKVTFLKDGNFEQLTFVSGNIGYFNLIKSSIEESFPVFINNSVKNNFPRYYRMSIEF